MNSNENEQLDSLLRNAFSGEKPDVSALRTFVRRKIRQQRVIRAFCFSAVASVLFISSVTYAVVTHAHRTRIYAELARDHHREVVNHEPRHWRLQGAEIDTLAARFGLSYAMAEAMTPLGFRLEQAKTCGMDGRPVLHLVYTDGAREISVYVRQTSKSNLAGGASSNLEQVVAFSTRRFDAAIVTNGTKRECFEFAHQAARIL